MHVTKVRESLKMPADLNRCIHYVTPCWPDSVSGYVELRDNRGRLRATASNRLINLETAVIAPMACVPLHFSRLDPMGRCPMCKGSRGVTAISEALVIGDQEATPDSDSFLTVEAAAVLKGIRKNDLNPFLRRLAKEGLWDLATSFKRLDREKRGLILYGFWSRPGSGSFLKTPQSNPSEVGSWLRWDGLYRHIMDQAHRSRDEEWARRITESARVIGCVRCGGSGLQRFASLLNVGVKSFAEWTRLSDPDLMSDLLDEVEPQTSRQRRTRERIVHCLAPLAHAGASAISVFENAVESFTTMTAVESGKLGES